MSLENNPGAVYDVFGLKLKCDLASAPQSGMAKSPQSRYDAEIITTEVPDRLENPLHEGPVIAFDGRSVLLKFKGIAKYLITDGHTIKVQPYDGAKEGDVATFAFGSALGTMLHQRGILALHGSAIATPQGAVIFTGNQGAGKSTTASSLSNRGFRFMADDICAVHIENNKPVLYPGLTRAKLTAESYHAVVGKAPDNEPLSPITDKYGAIFEHSTHPSPLHAIVALERTENNLHMEQLSGTERLSVLLENIYRPSLHKMVVSPDLRFKVYSIVSENILAYRLQRPAAFERLGEVIDLLDGKFGV